MTEPEPKPDLVTRAYHPDRGRVTLPHPTAPGDRVALTWESRGLIRNEVCTVVRTESGSCVLHPVADGPVLPPDLPRKPQIPGYTR